MRRPEGGPSRLFGRMCADLQYLDIRDVLGSGVHEYLDQLVQRLNHAGDEITKHFFSLQVILPGAKRSVQQVQQQQQYYHEITNRTSDHLHLRRADQRGIYRNAVHPSDACGQTCLSFSLNTEPRGR